MKICSVCRKISATDEDHLDCREKRSGMADVELTQLLPGKSNVTEDKELAVEVRALLEYMARQKER